jgi:hypothetical protein
MPPHADAKVRLTTNDKEHLAVYSKRAIPAGFPTRE